MTISVRQYSSGNQQPDGDRCVLHTALVLTCGGPVRHLWRRTVSAWTETGSWVGHTEDPADIARVLAEYEQHRAAEEG